MDDAFPLRCNMSTVPGWRRRDASASLSTAMVQTDADLRRKSLLEGNTVAAAGLKRFHCTGLSQRLCVQCSALIRRADDDSGDGEIEDRRRVALTPSVTAVAAGSQFRRRIKDGSVFLIKPNTH